MRPSFKSILMFTVAAGVVGGGCAYAAHKMLPETMPARGLAISGAALVGNALGYYWATR